MHINSVLLPLVDVSIYLFIYCSGHHREIKEEVKGRTSAATR